MDDSSSNWLFAKLANEDFNFKKESDEMKKKIAKELYRNAKEQTRLAKILKLEKNQESVANFLETTRPTFDKYCK